MIILNVQGYGNQKPTSFSCGDGDGARGQSIARDLRCANLRVQRLQTTEGGDFIITVWCNQDRLEYVIMFVGMQAEVWRLEAMLG